MAAENPWPQTMNDLVEIVDNEVACAHDYNTVVDAMATAAVAAMNYVAHELGASGFQASCADLEIVKRTRHLDCPFALLTADSMLFPQYDPPSIKAIEYEAEWTEWAQEEARKKLREDDAEPTFTTDDDEGNEIQLRRVHPNVRAHWEELADGEW